MTFDLVASVRTYRTLLDAEDRALHAGPPFLLLDGRTQPVVSSLAGAVAIAMAMRELNPGVNSAFRYPERPAPPPVVAAPTQ